MNTKNIELLAPAGNWESLTAAVQNGADAVYLGGQILNARRTAGNFDADGLAAAVDYCHERDVRVYITVNTMVKQTEMADLTDIAAQIARAGADAAIIGEIGVARKLKLWLPSLELHASTQMAVHNRQGVLAAQNMGFQRVVLAREMTDEEIQACSGAGVELEAFAHGALCTGCSGQCLFSSLIGGRSGNRGMCAQPCRLPYALSGDAAKEGGRFTYRLSPRDLCQIDRLDALRRAGIASIKLEGRLKRPEYVAVVTRAYRSALDALFEGRDFDVDSARTELLQIFNRGGFTRGYGPGVVDAELIYPGQPNHLGIRVGRVSGYNAQLERAVHAEDTLVMRSEGVEDIPVKLSGEAGRRVRVKLQMIPPEGAEIFRLHDDAQLKRARASYEEEHISIPLEGEAWLHTGESARMRVSDEEVNIEVSGGTVEPARNRALNEERAAAQLSKTGGTPYRFETLTVHCAEDAFLPASALNELRRLALEALRLRRIALRRGCSGELEVSEEGTPGALPLGTPPKGCTPLESPSPHGGGKPFLCVQAATVEQLIKAARLGADELYYAPADVTGEGLEAVESQLSGAWIVLPMVVSERTLYIIYDWVRRMGDRVSGVIASNIAHFSLDWPCPVRADFSMNIANAASLEVLADAGVLSYVPSVELTAAEIRSLAGACSMDRELIVYGRLPLFQLRHCPLNASIGNKAPHRLCRHCDVAPEILRADKHLLIDRKRVSFPLQRLRTNEGCIVRVLNSVPLMLLRKWSRLPQASRVRVILTDESDAMVEAVLKLHRTVIDGGNPRDMREWMAFEAMPSTTGHYFRGVE